jgi:hypothetical protein
VALGTSWHWSDVRDASNSTVLYSLSAGVHTLTFAYREDGAKLDRVVLTDDLAFVPTGSGPAPATLAFEAEGLSVTNSGVGTSLQTDANSSGGTWVSLNATGTGQWMEFFVPDVPAGTYALKMRYKTNNNRGQLTLSVDGAPIGSLVDQYATPASHLEATFGTVTFAAAGNHVVRLTTVGKNPSSSGYILSADRFTLQ